MVFEIFFVLLLAYYFIIEINELVGEISNKRKDYEKEQKKKIAREKRRKEIYEDKQDEEDG
jgi:hypothetical protein